MKNSDTSFRLRSFVRRDSRATKAQEEAFTRYFSQYALPFADGPVDFTRAFQRDCPVLLEIGFGMGQTLLEAATLHPDKNFIGVETHKPGIGTLLLGIKERSLNNLRIFYGDVVDVLQKGVSPASLAGIQIFFPDPWPKRRHHPRRLVQTSFLQLIYPTLIHDAHLHLATDWEDYARHMEKVLEQEKNLIAVGAVGDYSHRSLYRPIISKFEARAIQEKRQIYDFQYQYYPPIDKQQELP